MTLGVTMKGKCLSLRQRGYADWVGESDDEQVKKDR